MICIYCKQHISDKHAISGARNAHYATDDNDFGCDFNPINTEDGVGNHEPNIEEIYANE